MAEVKSQSKRESEIINSINQLRYPKLKCGELLQTVKDNFESWDKNKDKQIDTSEVAAALRSADLEKLPPEERVALEFLGKSSEQILALNPKRREVQSGDPVNSDDISYARQALSDCDTNPESLLEPQKNNILSLREHLNRAEESAASADRIALLAKKLIELVEKDFGNVQKDFWSNYISQGEVGFQTKYVLNSPDRKLAFDFLDRVLDKVQKLSNDEIGAENNGVTKADLKEAKDKLNYYLTAGFPGQTDNLTEGERIGVDLGKAASDLYREYMDNIRQK